jgi:large subunit ribosomal protein L18
MTEHVTKQMKQKRERRERAHMRIRQRVRGNSERPRLSVFKSLRYISVQLIDDEKGNTLAQASSSDPEIRQQLTGSLSNKDAAKLVGETIAQRAKAKGIEKVVFDRGGYVYHGNVKTLADAAREKGLQF